MRSPIVASCLAAIALVACGPVEPAAEVPEAELTSDAVDGAVTESSLLLTVLRVVDEPVTDAAQTRRGLLRVRAQLADFYGACATLTVNEAQRRVDARLVQCAGRGQLRNVSGAVSYTFTPAPVGVQVQVSARDLRVGAALIDSLDATATLRIAAALREVSVTQSRLVYHGALGRYVDTTLTRTTTTRWNQTAAGECYAYEGARRVVTREADGREGGYALEVNGYQRCTGQCPRAAMDVVVLTTLDGATALRASYYGGATARWVKTVGGNRVASGSWRLACN